MDPTSLCSVIQYLSEVIPGLKREESLIRNVQCTCTAQIFETTNFHCLDFNSSVNNHSSVNET